MTDNEFDHLFSENLKNSRSFINPDETDWQELSSKIDRFQSKRRYWLRALPWLLLLLVSSYTLWLFTSLNKIEQKLVENSTGKDFYSRLRDTLFLEKNIYYKDTIYKYLPYYDGVKKPELSNNDKNKSYVGTNNPLDIKNDKDTVIKNKSWEPFDHINSGNNLSILFSQEGEEKPKVKYFSDKIGNKLNIKSSVGFSVGSLLPIISNEIKNPVAMAFQAEFEILPRFSIKPSLLYTQHFFELEDLNSAKIVLSSTIYPQGSYTLHEIKGIKKTIIPAIACNYYFYKNKNLEGYSGIGIASDFTLPTQMDYEFKDLTNNNTYKYSLKDKLGSSNTSFFSTIGGKFNPKYSVSFFGEIRVGISKNQTSEYIPFLAALSGFSFVF